MEDLTQRGIQTNVYYEIPHHLQPGYSHLGYRAGDLPVAEQVCRQGIALPLYPELGAERVDRVIAAVSDFLDGRRCGAPDA